MKVKLSDIEQWVAHDRVEPKKDDEYTVEEYASLIGRSPDAARAILKRHVAANKWKQRKTVVGGKSANVFCPIAPPK